MVLRWAQVCLIAVVGFGCGSGLPTEKAEPVSVNEMVRDMGLEPGVTPTSTAESAVEMATSEPVDRKQPWSPEGLNDPDRIQAGDQIQIMVLGHPDVSLSLTVPRSGTIKLPMAGQLQIGGVSPIEVGKRVAQMLEERELIPDADVTVYIAEYASKRVFLQGALTRSTMIDIPRHQSLTLTQAIAMTGGFSGLADRTRVRIIRRMPNKEPQFLTVDTTMISRPEHIHEDVELIDGDIVVVGSEEKIYLMGQVSRPGAYSVTSPSERTFVKLLGVAGGFAAGAQSKAVVVMLKQPDGSYRRRQVNGREMLQSAEIGRDFQVPPGSIIYVPISFW